MTFQRRRQTRAPRRKCKLAGRSIRAVLGVAIVLMIAWNTTHTVDPSVVNDHSATAAAAVENPTYQSFFLNSHKKKKQQPQIKTHHTTATTTTTTTTTNNTSHYFHHCTPTHHACDGYRGILHIENGDFGGAGGTIFFQFIIAQLIYAEEHQLLPFLHMDNFSYLVYDDAIHSGSSGEEEIRVEFKALQGVQVDTIQDPRWRRAIPILDRTRQKENETLVNSYIPTPSRERVFGIITFILSVTFAQEICPVSASLSSR